MRGRIGGARETDRFYVDRETPSRWVPYFIEAVNAWQKAFERIGFKNAIRGELAPTPEENPDFSEYDSRYSFYFVESFSGAECLRAIDSRSEIR